MHYRKLRKIWNSLHINKKKWFYKYNARTSNLVVSDGLIESLQDYNILWDYWDIVNWYPWDKYYELDSYKLSFLIQYLEDKSNSKILKSKWKYNIHDIQKTIAWINKIWFEECYAWIWFDEEFKIHHPEYFVHYIYHLWEEDKIHALESFSKEHKNKEVIKGNIKLLFVSGYINVYKDNKLIDNIWWNIWKWIIECISNWIKKCTYKEFYLNIGLTKTASSAKKAFNSSRDFQVKNKKITRDDLERIIKQQDKRWSDILEIKCL